MAQKRQSAQSIKEQKSRPNWVVIADQAETTVFEKTVGTKPHLRPIITLESPEARNTNSELIRHQRGKSVSGGSPKGRGARQYGVGSSRSPHENVADKFAQKIVNYLVIKYQAGKFQKLLFAAEPHFLGKVRPALKKALPKTKFLKKDLGKTPIRELQDRIDALDS